MKRISYLFLTFIFTIFLIGSSSCSSRARIGSRAPSPAANQNIKNELLQGKYPPVTNWMTDLIIYSHEFIGKPYGYKCSKDLYFDCSGYITFLFDQFGVKIPRSSNALSSFVNTVKDPAPGDLAFFTGSNKYSGRIGHVGLVITNDYRGVRIIHSTSSRGVMIDLINGNRYYEERFIKYGRIPGLRNR